VLGEEVGVAGGEQLPLEIISPGGFERYFAELEPLMAGGAPDIEGIVALGLTLVRGGILGESNGQPRRDRETMAAMFLAVSGGLDHGNAPPEGGTIQWEFTDAEPWHIVVANGATRAQPGRAERPSVTLRCRLRDWADVVAGRGDALRLAATGRLRPSGDLRWLWRARRMFPKA
jgi:SCP-2 sterol transfer family